MADLGFFLASTSFNAIARSQGVVRNAPLIAKELLNVGR